MGVRHDNENDGKETYLKKIKWRVMKKNGGLMRFNTLLSSQVLPHIFVHMLPFPSHNYFPK
jgi:hypothetical protein